MKALNLPSINTLKYEERPMPVCPPGYALLKMDAVGICGSDIHAYSGNQPYFTYPRVLGHEICATVVETGSPCDYSPGDRVVIIPYIPCGKCGACKHDKPNACTSMTTVGVHVDGGLMEYVAVPLSTLVNVSALDLPPEHLAMIEPLAIGAHAAMRATPQTGDTALVFGAGPIGIAVAQFLETYGATTLLAEVNPVRSEYAATQFGYRVLNPTDTDFEMQVKEAFSGDFADIVVDATGNKQSMNSSYHYIRSGGRIIFVGLFQGEFTINDPYFHLRESELLISRTATRSDFDYVIRCIAEQKVSIKKFLSHKGSFKQAEDLIPQWINMGAQVFKAAVLFD